jgi:hypothetical protein
MLSWQSSESKSQNNISPVAGLADCANRDAMFQRMLVLFKSDGLTKLEGSSKAPGGPWYV